MTGAIEGYIYSGKVADFYMQSIASYPYNDKRDALAMAQQFSKASAISLGLCVQFHCSHEGVKHTETAFPGCCGRGIGIRFDRTTSSTPHQKLGASNRVGYSRRHGHDSLFPTEVDVLPG